MEYVKFRNAKIIVNNSSYLVKNPPAHKNKWSNLFGNNKETPIPNIITDFEKNIMKKKDPFII